MINISPLYKNKNWTQFSPTSSSEFCLNCLKKEKKRKIRVIDLNLKTFQ